MGKWLRKYWIEVGAALLATSGILMVLVEPGAFHKLAGSIPLALAALASLGIRLDGWLSQFSLADLGGLALALLATAFILWRVRVRYLSSSRWLATNCPRCKGELMRIHRSTWDRFLGVVFLPHSRRYRCKDPQCGWTGLRHHHSQRRSSHRSLEQQANP